MRYLVYKGLRDSIADLYEQGGRFKKVAEKVYALLGKFKDMQDVKTNPFDGFHLTNRGESRIKHCWKYDLGAGCRLITICNNNIHVICYVGDHENCEKWLNRNRGLELTLNDKNQLEEVFSSQDITREERRIHTVSDLSTELLVNRISGRHLDKIFDSIPWTLSHRFSQLKSTATEDEIEALANQVDEELASIALFDVFAN